ncbi:helix-turn-helix domain-containing protein [Paenibacillus sp. GCM10027626]|uniref:helix-turn-helix domain-containing protein n=1 Tax=Paenibacillus sp. GCM10027626 TaxID=3273411 RepID=UPI00362B0480
MDNQEKTVTVPHYELDEVTNHFLSEYPVHCAYRTNKIGQQHLHAHEGFEIYFCTSGTGSLLVGDQLFPLHAGTLTVIPPNVLHRPYSEYIQPFQRFVLSVDVSYMKLLDQLCFTTKEALEKLLALSRFNDPAATGIPRGSHHILPAEQFEPVRALLDKLAQCATLDGIERELTQIRVLSELFLLIIQLNRLPAPAYPSRTADETIVGDVLAYLVAHYREDIQIHDLVSRFPVSRSRLLQLFKAKTGSTIVQFVNEYRLNQAKLLLRMTAQPVTEVAALAGFGDLSHFFSLFKRNVGLTPHQYRKSPR